MNPADTVTWDTDVETWQFPLDERQRLMLATCHAFCDDQKVPIVGVAPKEYGQPDLLMALPVNLADLKSYFCDEQDEPFIIRFGRMPLKVLMTLREHDGW